MRQCIYAMVAVMCVSANIVPARADTLVLNTPGPAAMVNVSDTGLSVSGECYCGLLNWTLSPATNPATTFHTYCIDINHDIGINGVYTYNLSDPLALGTEHTPPSGPLDPGLAISQPMVNAIYNLWETHIGGNNSGNTFKNTAGFGLADNDQAAAAFQMAIWEILYNSNSNPLSVSSIVSPSSPLQASAAGAFDGTPGASAAAFTAADSWASAAWTAGASTPSVILDMFKATSPESAQDQVYFVGVALPNNQISSTPLPTTVTGGLMLLGAIAVTRLPRRNGIVATNA